MNNEPLNLLRAAEKPLISSKEGRLKQFKFVVTGLLSVLVILCGISFGIIYSSKSAEPEQITHNQKVLKPRKVGLFETVKNFFFHSDDILDGQKEDRINILLLGMGGAGHEGAYLTDTNIIVSIKPTTNEVAMISIPRDLGVKIPGYTGLRKINSVHALAESQHPGEGGEITRKFFSETFDIPIPYYFRIDFKGFEEIIDTVGGATVDVPRSFTDYQYPGPNYSYRVVSFEAGKQTFNGEQALIYSRSRHGGNGEGSDFARARRQQQILSALKEKILSAGTYTNPSVIKKISDSLSQHIATNLDLKQIMYLATIAKDIDNTQIKNLVLDTSPNGYLVNYSQATLAPRGGNFTTINSAIKNIFEPAGASSSVAAAISTSPEKQVKPAIFPSAKIEVQNGTWQMGLATRVKKQLQDKGLDVYSVGNSVKRPIPTTTIYVLHESPSDQIITTLSKELKAQISTSIPEWLQSENTLNTSDSKTNFHPETDILVILGEDIKNRLSL